MSNAKVISIIDHEAKASQERARALKDELRIEIAQGVGQLMSEAINPLQAEMLKLMLGLSRRVDRLSDTLLMLAKEVEQLKGEALLWTEAAENDNVAGERPNDEPEADERE